MTFGAPGPRPRRGGWLRRNATATGTVVGVVIVLVAISVGTGVALTAHKSHRATSSPTAPTFGIGSAPPGSPTPSTPSTTSTTSAPLASGSSTSPPASGSRISGTGNDLVDDAIATQVFDSTWTPFAVAFATGNRTGIAQYADTDVQDAIAGYFDCDCGPWPTAYRSVHFSAPPQSAFPVSFLAEIHEVDFSHEPLVVEVVFSRASAGAQWLVSYLVSYVDGAGLLSADSNASAPTTPLDVSVVNGQLVSFFQTVFDGGAPPPDSFIETGSIKQETDRIIANRNALANDKFTETLTYSAGSHSIAFDASGSDLMCGEIRSYSVTTSSSGAPVVQPPNQSTFGEELPAGSYAAVKSHGIREACWYVTTSGTSPPVVTPISFLGGAYSRVGTPT